MHLEKLSPDEILEREIPTGAPILYELDSDLKVLNAKKL
jgi:bisphosphoglycerate-dependent phosphoglycerate mutase